MLNQPIPRQSQAEALDSFTENNSSRQTRVDEMMAASNCLQNNIRTQKSQTERLESELTSLRQSIAKTCTKLDDVRMPVFMCLVPFMLWDYACL